MKSNSHMFRQVLLMTLTAIVGGTVGYYRIEEGWSLFDSFYMTMITLTTIGFGEVHQLSTPGRLFTVGLVLFGLGAAATFAGHFARMLLDGELEEYWRTRRMERIIKRLKNHVIVCGYGRIGKAISHELIEMGARCVVVDTSVERQHEARDAGLIVMEGNATSDLALISAGINRAAVVVAALSQDSDNVFIALTARDLNPEVSIIARAEDRAVESRMLKAGVNRVAYPAQLCGGQIAHLVSKEMGLNAESKEFRRATDVLGYDLQIYRNVSQKAQTVAQVLEETRAQKALALVRLEGNRTNDPADDDLVEEMDAVVLLVDTTAPLEAKSSKSVLRSSKAGNLSVGVTSLDEEHQQILSLIRSLENSDSTNDREIIHDVPHSLLDYTKHHFKNEESLFMGTGYPDADMHVAQHNAMIKKVQQMIGDEKHVHPANLAKLLEDWMVQHIQKTDKGYVEYVSKVTVNS